MFQKSFVSIVFYPDKIQVLKLDSKRKRVVKFSQFEVPPGVIMKYRVRDQVALSKIISQVWRKMGLHDKFVGVVVPEFSTYTKTLSLPALATDEIDEAIQWQLQEFLPTAPNNVISDWKIVKRTAESIDVLVVAILRDILFGYVDAVGHAGLYPLVVETPSLSLERITGGDTGGKMILYVSSHETLLILAEGEKIVASSVVNTNKVEDTLNTATRMIEHYRHVKVEHVHIGGVALTQDLIQYLNFNLGIPVQLISYSIAGIANGQAQDYLSAISMQLTDPAEPESERTVNLLPPGWATHYKHKLRDIRYWTLTLLASVVVWAAFLSTVIVFMLIGMQSDQLQREHAASGEEDYGSVIVEVENINKLTSKTLAITSRIVPPQVVINKIAATKPPGVTISLYDLNMESGRVTIAGVAATRGDLIALKNALEQENDFDDIEVPISSLVNEANLDFQINLNYVPVTAVKKVAPKLNI
ncbi:hypothetical protein A2801_02480 [Candidatus Woesebacteria bacterium RIFCSPHIGHO2_01_FULL_41_10]|uniref:SHS2 domain-containing protein n=1 Tax=Candidatus Woesebacteria bacterium RIFCSPHIGHO2_01_FULL_41_10 TaxID=1802500 RepID=A0A1F7YM79_9BACT|nr:MAG: hypothetical protein A2801_02480 [Candidatus Woesebacteria bacterium RIFCSPHIGHO2_01_FULL_41_10]